MESVVEPLSIRLQLPELRITGVEEMRLGWVYSEETLLLEMVLIENLAAIANLGDTATINLGTGLRFWAGTHAAVCDGPGAFQQRPPWLRFLVRDEAPAPLVRDSQVLFPQTSPLPAVRFYFGWNEEDLYETKN